MTTIVIPTCPGNENFLSECLKSLVMNNTEKEYKIAVIKNDYKGFAKAVNEGLLMATDDDGQIDDVLLINDDTLLMPNFMEKINEVKGEFDIIGPPGQIRNGNHLAFFFVFIKSAVIEKIGLLDERFEIGEWEDVDYCIRAIEAGFKIGEAKDYVCKHYTHGTIDRLTPEQHEKRKLNKGIFLDKWKGTKYEEMWK